MQKQYDQSTYFCYEGTRACATCWKALWHLDALRYEGCEPIRAGIVSYLINFPCFCFFLVGRSVPVFERGRYGIYWDQGDQEPETTIVNQLLHADSIPGRLRPGGRPHYTWMDGVMQDLNALGPRLQLDLLRDWPKLVLDRELWRGVASRC